MTRTLSRPSAGPGLVVGLLLAGCGDPASPDSGGAGDVPVEHVDRVAAVAPLPAPRLLRRLSLDLRGVLPTAAELDAVEADPAQVAAYRDAWLTDPRLEARLVDLYAERWHTLVDDYDIEYFDYRLDPEQEYSYERSVGQEPLRLLAWVATNDLPWSEVVLADYTRADEMLGAIWPIEYPDGATGWQSARYTDGRPAVGVLASNGLWWRYATSSFNQNRGRANAISRLLLCVDMLRRPVSFSSTPSLLDDSATTTALRSEDYCIACHAAIEPIAANLFGFYPNDAYNVYEMSNYHPEREPVGPDLLDVSPAWFGKATPSLRAMAEAIAVDPRFDRCAVETLAAGLWRREVGVDDYDRIDTLREGFEAGGTRVLPLLAALTDTPEYTAGAPLDDADDATIERERTARLLSPTQLDTAVADLTGYSWDVRGYEQLRNDRTGYRVLAGGVNGMNVLTPQDDPGLTWALVIKRLAEAAAASAVRDGFESGTGELFAGVDAATRPDDAAFETTIAAWWWRLYATRPTDADLAGVRSLWSTVEATDGPATAWTITLAALLRDPAFVSY